MSLAPGEPCGNVPDPESAAPVQVPTGMEEGIPPDGPGRPLPERVAATPPVAYALSAVLPGAGHLVVGERGRGLWLLLAWGALGALAVAIRDRIAAAIGGAFDQQLAGLTLALLIAGIWGWALWDLATRKRRAGTMRGDSQWSIAARMFRRNRLAVAGLIVIVLFYLVALLAPLLAPYDPIEQDIARALQPPQPGNWLGTDRFGRDVLSRIIYGSRISLSIGFIATAISITIGTLLGATAGFFGRRTDTLIMRFTDTVLAFPRLILLILVIALFNPSILAIILVLGLTQWPGTTRIVRGDVLSLRERDFIHAAQALGMSRARVLLRHVVPNVLAPVIVAATLGIGNTIVLEAGLSFLGIGVPPPTPTWGSMVAEGRDYLLSAWWLATFPGLTIVFVVLAFNLVGDGLRDALDPRLRT